MARSFEESITDDADKDSQWWFHDSDWDRDAFWFPTLDRRGALLLVAVVLFAFHFDELLGLTLDQTLLFGWLPVNFAYHIFKSLVHVGFLYLLYLNWPAPPPAVEKKFRDSGSSLSGSMEEESQP